MLEPKMILRSIAMSCVMVIMTSFAALAQETSSPEKLLKYTGLYKIGENHEIGISMRRAGGRSILVLSDIQTDAIRALFPQGEDRFIAGREMIRPEPAQYHISFRKNSRGEVTSLVIREDGLRIEQVGHRQPQRTVPVKFHNGDVSLVGTLYLPDRKGPRFPAVVLSHGSEDNDRYSFDSLPYVLSHRGIAVLTYDKRGTGQSTGSWQDSGLETLADDLVAAVALLKSRRDIDSRRLGVIGFSEGGWVAPLAASKSPDLRFIVSISGGAFTKGISFIYKYRQQFLEDGLAGESLNKALAEKEAIVAQSAEKVKSGKQPSGFDKRITYDPADDWSSFKGSVLYMVGEFDVLEPAEQSAKRLGEILKESGNSDFTIKLFPRAHHGMLLGVTGKPSEFFSLRGISQFVPGYWDVLLCWLDSRLDLS